MRRDITTQSGKIVQRLVWVLGGVIAAGAIVVALILAWSGFAPGLSALVGADRPRDLGVQSSAVDRQQYLSKSGERFQPNSPSSEDSVSPERSVPLPETQTPDEPRWIETSFTQEELTAALNQDAPEWLPLRDMQLRLSDETVEVSGLLETRKVPRLLQRLRRRGTDDADLARIAEYVDKLPRLVPVYVKATGAVRDAQLDLALQEVEVGRLPLPLATLAEGVPTILRETVKRTDHFAIDSAIPQDGSLAFRGILPRAIPLQGD
jgi:hypothetical protein